MSEEKLKKEIASKLKNKMAVGGAKLSPLEKKVMEIQNKKFKQPSLNTNYKAAPFTAPYKNPLK